MGFGSFFSSKKPSATTPTADEVETDNVVTNTNQGTGEDIANLETTNPPTPQEQSNLTPEPAPQDHISQAFADSLVIDNTENEEISTEQNNNVIFPSENEPKIDTAQTQQPFTDIAGNPNGGLTEKYNGVSSIINGPEEEKAILNTELEEKAIAPSILSTTSPEISQDSSTPINNVEPSLLDQTLAKLEQESIIEENKETPEQAEANEQYVPEPDTNSFNPNLNSELNNTKPEQTDTQNTPLSNNYFSPKNNQEVIENSLDNFSNSEVNIQDKPAIEDTDNTKSEPSIFTDANAPKNYIPDSTNELWETQNTQEVKVEDNHQPEEIIPVEVQSPEEKDTFSNENPTINKKEAVSASIPSSIIKEIQAILDKSIQEGQRIINSIKSKIEEDEKVISQQTMKLDEMRKSLETTKEKLAEEENTMQEEKDRLDIIRKKIEDAITDLQES